MASGLAGGSFAVGIAYVSRFFPAEKQGTALGIFGVGNVGAAVTKFLAPFVLLAWGWQAVALDLGGRPRRHGCRLLVHRRTTILSSWRARSRATSRAKPCCRNSRR